MDKLINILLLNWNSSQEIESFFDRALPDYVSDDVRIFLIDNCSSDEDKENLSKIYSKWQGRFSLHLIFNDKNLGYAGGNNRGYHYIRDNSLDGDILILNPDVSLSWNSLTELKSCLNDDVGIVMPRTAGEDGSIIYDYIVLDGLRQYYFQTKHRVHDTDYAVGACILINRRALDQLELFDERFFMYWEEVDLSIRYRRGGYRVISSTKAQAIRRENSPSRNVNAVYYYIRNSFLLRHNHNEMVSLVKFVWFLSLALLGQVRLSVVQGELERLIKYYQGFKDGVSQSWGKLK